MTYRKDNNKSGRILSKEQNDTLTDKTVYFDIESETTRQNLRKIYEVLGRELMEKSITFLGMTIERYSKLITDEIDNQLKKLNEHDKRFEYYKCDKCDGLSKNVKAIEKLYMEFDNSGNNILKNFLDIDFENFSSDCTKCGGTGIVDWVKRTRQ